MPASKMQDLADVGEDLCVVDMLRANTEEDVGAILQLSLSSHQLLGPRTSLEAPPHPLGTTDTKRKEVLSITTPTQGLIPAIKEAHHSGFISGDLLKEVHDFTMSQDCAFKRRAIY